MKITQPPQCYMHSSQPFPASLHRLPLLSVPFDFRGISPSPLHPPPLRSLKQKKKKTKYLRSQLKCTLKTGSGKKKKGDPAVCSWVILQPGKAINLHKRGDVPCWPPFLGGTVSIPTRKKIGGPNLGSPKEVALKPVISIFRVFRVFAIWNLLRRLFFRLRRVLSTFHIFRVSGSNR